VPPQPTPALPEEIDQSPRLPLPPAAGSGRRQQASRRQALVGGIFDPSPIGQQPKHGHGQHQPVAGDTDGLGKSGLVPLSAHPCEAAEAYVDPHPQPIPTEVHASGDTSVKTTHGTVCAAAHTTTNVPTRGIARCLNGSPRPPHIASNDVPILAFSYIALQSARCHSAENTFRDRFRKCTEVP
jgi:hypothetical protein